MSIFDKIRFLSKLKYQWNQIKNEDRINAFLDNASCEEDLIRKPEYIKNCIIRDVKKIAIDGIKLGSSASSIAEDKIKEIQKSPWPGTYFYHCDNGVTYKVISDMVVQFFITGDLLSKTGLHSEEDALNSYGKPDKIKYMHTGPVVLLKSYIYKKRHLIIEIDVSGNITRINILK